MEQILDSIRNGQGKQAIEQLKESSFCFTDLLEELRAEGMEADMIKMVKIGESVGFITYEE